MRTHLLILCLAALLLLAGCKTVQQATPPSIGPLEVGGFTQHWESNLALTGNDRIEALHLRNDMLFAYTQRNRVIALSANGGRILWMQQVGRGNDQILPPLVLEKNVTVIPGVSTIHKIGALGQTEPPLEIGHSIRSPITGVGNFVYCGLDFPNGGHFAKIDLTKQLNYTLWEFMTRSAFSSGPVLFQNIVYAAGENGMVYALNEAGKVVWPIQGGAFRTESAVLADLRVDIAGLYVASTDTKLYCLDPQTGKIKWQFYAGAPLNVAPEVTATMVYQFIRGQGVAAISKESGEYLRKPLWIAPNASGFLAEDANHAYLRDVNNGIIGVDKKTGEEKFRSRRTDLAAFASNPTGDTIFAATASGQVLGIRPVTKAGAVGLYVKTELEFEPVAMAR